MSSPDAPDAPSEPPRFTSGWQPGGAVDEPRPPVEVRSRGIGVLGTIVVAAATALVVGIFGGLMGYTIGRMVTSSAAPAPSTPAVAPAAPVTAAPAAPAPVPAGEGAITPIRAVVEAVLPSVVSLLVEGPSESGSGSGFVLRSDGYILTNHHVVDVAGKSGSITVVLNDGTKLEGTVVGSNIDYDIAVVKVIRDDLPAVALGDSAAVQVGDEAIAIGAPLGLDGTVTSGIVSAVDRPVTAGGEGSSQAFINAIQTDAAINPGNSGGPLLDGAGRVIGVNSAIATMGAMGQEAGSIGLGFAIPVNSARRIAEEIIESGRASTPIIGVSLDTSFDGDGAKVQTVTPGGPSAKAGLQPGDILTKLDDRVIDDATELVVAIRDHRPGDVVSLEYLRDGQRGSVTLTLGSGGDTAP